MSDTVPAQQQEADGGGVDNFMQMVQKVEKESANKDMDGMYVKTAWLCLHREAFPRKQCIAIVSNVWFDRVILSLIAINCATMAMFSSPIIKNMIEGECDGYERFPANKEVHGFSNCTALITEKSQWASEHWTFTFLKAQEGCSLNDVAPCSIAQTIDFIFLIIFTIEMLIKMLAMGLFHGHYAYLCNAWNWLDFVVVCVGYLEMAAAGLPGIKAIRLVKALRPLRSLQRIRGLRVLVQCILEALPQMLNVGVFLIFMLVIFGLFGQAFFAGKLRHTCHECTGTLLSDGTCLGGAWESTGDTCDAECGFDDDGTLDSACKSLGNLTYGLMQDKHSLRWTYSCRPGQQCLCTSKDKVDLQVQPLWGYTSGNVDFAYRNASVPIAADPAGYGEPNFGELSASCDYLSNPNYGITSFDSMPWAMVSLFQAISLEGWVDMMYQLMDGASFLVVIYFVLLVLVGAIIVMNLFLAVLCNNFEMADADGEPKEQEEDATKALARAMDTLQHTNQCRAKCLQLVRWPKFDFFVQGCILFNTLLMCLKWVPGPSNVLDISVSGDVTWDYLEKWHGITLMTFNILLTTIFTLESIIKVIALGPNLFRKDSMNVFDAFVVAFSIIEIALDLNTKSDPDAMSLPLPLSVLRAFRVFRLFKLVRSIKSMRKILVTLVQSLASVVYLAMLLCLIILIFILLGMELFGGRYPHAELNYTKANFPYTFEKNIINWDDAEFGSRYHFDDFGSALLSIFVVLSGENWNEIMFDSHRASWDDTGAFAIIYFILLFVVGNLLLFNLFIAILLSNFEDDEEEEEEEGGEGEEKKAAEIYVRLSLGQYVKDPGPNGDARPSISKGEEDEPAPKSDVDTRKPFPEPAQGDDTGGDKSLGCLAWDNPFRVFCAKAVLHKYFEPVVLVLILVSTLFLVIDMPHYSEKTTLRQVMLVFNYIFTVLFTIEMLLKISSMGFCKSKTPKHFVLSTAYMRDGWNILDFVIVLVSIAAISLPTEGGAGPILKQLRVARALRPLRLVSRYPALKVTFNTLLMSIPSMASLMSVTSLFFLIFAILGLELFGGKFGVCQDPDGDGVAVGIQTVFVPDGNGGTIKRDISDYEECMSKPRYNITRRTTDGILLTDMADITGDRSYLEYTEFPQWMYPQFGSFDNVFMSLILLFEVSALEAWPDVMHMAMDADSKELFVQPYQVDSNPLSWMDSDDWGKSSNRARLDVIPAQKHVTSNVEAAIFFVLWIIFGCFVIVNMTVGVVCDTFADIKAENDGLLLMTKAEAEWVEAQRHVLSQRPMKVSDPPKAPWRLPFFKLVVSSRFEITVMVVILLNMLQMSCDFFEPHGVENTTDDIRSSVRTLKDVMEVLNIIFFGLYVIEMVLKWIGLGLNEYYKSGWNCFDCFLVFVSAVDIVFSMQDSDLPFPVAVMRVLRLFRVARILRIIKTAKQLRTIVMTVYISVPQLKNILVLMVLIILIADMLLVGFFFSVNYTPGYFSQSDQFYEKYYAEGGIQVTGGVPKFQGQDNMLYGAPYAGEVYHADDYHYSPGTNWGEAINRHANFATFWTGLLTLIRSSTGESFNMLMHDLNGPEWGHNRLTCCTQCGPVTDGDWETLDLSHLSPQRITEITGSAAWTSIRRIQPETSCGITAWSMTIYFVFQMIMAYIVLSIMIGVILENFSQVGDSRKVTMEDIEHFRDVWRTYDPKGTFVVPSHNLLAILQQLPPPLGIHGMNPGLSRPEMLKLLADLDIPDHKGFMHFTEVLTALSAFQMGAPVPYCDATKRMMRTASCVPALKKLEHAENTAFTSYLVSLLQTRISAHTPASETPS